MLEGEHTKDSIGHGHGRSTLVSLRGSKSAKGVEQRERVFYRLLYIRILSAELIYMGERKSRTVSRWSQEAKVLAGWTEHMPYLLLWSSLLSSMHNVIYIQY